MNTMCYLGEGERPVFDNGNRWHNVTSLDIFTPQPIREGTLMPTSNSETRPAYDLSGRDFIRKNFADEQMIYTHAVGAQFHDVTFLRCNLTVTMFQRAIFSEVRFLDCIMDYSAFEDAKLTDVCFYGSSLKGTDIHSARLTRVCFDHAHFD